MKIKNVIKNAVEKIKDVAEDIKEEIEDIGEDIKDNVEDVAQVASSGRLALDYNGDYKRNLISFMPFMFRPTIFIFGSILPEVFPKLPANFPIWNTPPFTFPFGNNIPFGGINGKKGGIVSEDEGTWSYDSDTTVWSFSSSDSLVAYSIAGLPENVNERNIDRKVSYSSDLNELSLPRDINVDDVHVVGLESDTNVIIGRFAGSTFSLADTDGNTVNGYELVDNSVVFNDDGTWSYDSDTTAWSFSSSDSDSSVEYSITGLPESVSESNIDRKVSYDSTTNTLFLPRGTDIDDVHVLGLESDTGVVIGQQHNGSNYFYTLAETDNNTVNGYEIVTNLVAYDIVIDRNSPFENRTENIISGGSGDDTLRGTGRDDIFVHTSGNDVFKNFNAKKDKIGLSGSTIVSSFVKGSDVIFNTENGSMTLKNMKNKELTIIDEDGNETSKLYNSLVYDDKKHSLKASSKFDGDMIDLEDYAPGIKKVEAAQVKSAISIVGDEGDNSIKGGSGNDTLSGGAGDDTLYGGKGEDTFVYSSGKDVIKDYKAGQDVVFIQNDDFDETNFTVKGKDVIFNIDDDNSLTFKNTKVNQITFVAVEADDDDDEQDIWFADDDNFVSGNSNRLDDILTNISERADNLIGDIKNGFDAGSVFSNNRIANALATLVANRKNK